MKSRMLVLLTLLAFIYGAAAGQSGNFDVEFDRSSNGLQFSATSSWNRANKEIKFSTDHARRTFTAKFVDGSQTNEVNGNFNIVGRKVMLTGTYTRKSTSNNRVYHTSPVKFELEKKTGHEHAYLIKFESQYVNGELKVIYQNGALLINGNVNRYSLSGNIKVDAAKPYLMRGEISATRGGSETFKLALNTQRFPYTFEIFPASIAGLRISNNNDDGASDMWFLEADFKEEKYLHINSNSNKFSSFNIDRMSGDRMRYELNGKELLQSKTGSSGSSGTSSLFSLPSGFEGQTNLQMKRNNDYLQNEVSLDMDIGKPLKGSLDWDIRTPSRHFHVRGNMSL